MTDREKWDALVSMIGKPEAYRVAHAGELDARAFWTEFEYVNERLPRYAWRIALDQFCDQVALGINRPA